VNRVQYINISARPTPSQVIDRNTRVVCRHIYYWSGSTGGPRISVCGKSLDRRPVVPAATLCTYCTTRFDYISGSDTLATRYECCWSLLQWLLKLGSRRNLPRESTVINLTGLLIWCMWVLQDLKGLLVSCMWVNLVYTWVHVDRWEIYCSRDATTTSFGVFQ
jgi:hypothetical protein